MYAVGWCLRERSRRKTLKEVLPELRQADPATIREIGRLLIPARFQIQQNSSPRQEVPRPPPPDQAEPPNEAVS